MALLPALDLFRRAASVLSIVCAISLPRQFSHGRLGRQPQYRWRQGNDTVRTEHWRYIRYAGGSEELYDHRNDPNEWTNLVAQAQLAAVKQDLARWVPKSPAPSAAASAPRVLVKDNGIWLREGKPIKAEDKED
jgi:hypothetical protein